MGLIDVLLTGKTAEESESESMSVMGFLSKAWTVADLVSKEVAFLRNVENKIKSLEKKLIETGFTLEKADVMTETEEELDARESELRELVFKGEDIIDVINNNGTPDVFHPVMGFFLRIVILHKLKNDIEDVDGKLHELSAKTGSQIQIPTSTVDGKKKRDEGDQIVGFQEEAENLVSLLTNKEPLGRLVVGAIWAPGGAGKTALAQNIYNRIVKSEFDFVAWVSVSPNFVAEDIWHAILEQVKELSEEEKMELETKEGEELRRMVREYLEGKNYLIVVDGLWTKDDRELIITTFPISSQMKCSVLLTTRIEEVARGADPLTAPVKLRVLNETESMELFLKKVYRCSLDLVPSLSEGKKIAARKLVSKCEGLPLAIVLLGGVLSNREPSIDEWRLMRDRVHSCLSTESRDFRKVVALSYNELPYPLKSCFLYFGLFPEDSVIECDKLIRLWVAEGFLKRITTAQAEAADKKKVEDAARKCLMDLKERSMIQIVEWKSGGDPQSCRAQGLVRALAVQKAKKAKISIISMEKKLGSSSSSTSSSSGSRRIALHSTDIGKTPPTVAVSLLPSKAASTVTVGKTPPTAAAPPLFSSKAASTVKVRSGQLYHIGRSSRDLGGIEEDDVMVGFQEKEADKVASWLRKTKPRGRLAIVSIVGNGGGGKTTLARKVYNRDDVIASFDCRAWVYVSQDYVLKDLLQIMLQQVTIHKDDKYFKHKKEEELQSMLRDSLEGKNYLMVLDDLWREEDWDVIERVLPKPIKGQKCRVLVTSRNLDVAKYADPSTDWLMLQPLNESESLKLFLETVFKCSVHDIPKEILSQKMKDKAREIIEICDGIPLIILLLGGLVSVKKRGVSAWDDVLQSLNRHGGRHLSVLQVVEFCYVDLPDYLRFCISSFLSFPSQDTIKCDTLIQSWAAGGFLETTTHEDVARRCLEELIQRNLIKVATRRRTTRESDWAPETCRIHVPLRDFLVMEAKRAQFSKNYNPMPHSLQDSHPHQDSTLDWIPKASLSFPTLQRDQQGWAIIQWTSGYWKRWKESGSKKSREALISLKNYLHSIPNLSRKPVVHSLLCFSETPPICYQQFHLLRVLDLEGAENLDELPIEIRNLTLLRYLSLRGTGVKSIPPWIANLRYLQTLDAPHSKIPIDTLRLKRLRHLFANSLSSSTSPHDSSSSSLSLCIGNLEQLQTLELDLGDWVTNGSLHDLTDLRVLRLRLNGGDDIESRHIVLLHAIANMKRLKVFRLTQGEAFFSSPIDLPSLSTHEDLIEMVVEGTFTKLPRSNDLPEFLTYLWLEIPYTTGLDSVDPLFTLQKLPCLKKLCLRLFKDVRMTCSEGGFQQLEYLYIRVYFEPINWTVEKGALPRLRVFHIEGDHRLGQLPDGLKYITTMEELVITRGYDVRDSLQNREEQWENVKDIPSLKIKYLDDSSERP